MNLMSNNLKDRSSRDDTSVMSSPADTIREPVRIDSPAEWSSSAGSLVPKPSGTFVLTPRVEAITRRAMTYLECGYAIHLAGPAGTGKTTLAFHIAAQLRRAVTLIHGNDEFGTSDLVGRDAGYRKSTLVDNYVRSVLKTEENVVVHWMDNRLTSACEHGHTLIYDEFNRSRPEANNTLLSILEEGILNLPKIGGGDGYMKVHPKFRAIFTSNPEEYAGVHKTQDALLDRLITLRVDHYDAETERDITSSKAGISPSDAAYIVSIARTLRDMGSGHRPTIRACIALAKVVAQRGAAVTPEDVFFVEAAHDVFGDVVEEIAHTNKRFGAAAFDELLTDLFTGGSPERRAESSDPTAPVALGTANAPSKFRRTKSA